MAAQETGSNQLRGALLKRKSEASTHAERLADSIAESVLTNEFPPGFRLDEAALAERFGVSRTPVREAIRLLASTGLIEVKPRRGASVATATSAQLETLFGAMAEIEATCARLAAISMTPIERRRLQGRHDAMAEVVAARRPGGLRRRQCRLPYADLSRRAQRDSRRNSPKASGSASRRSGGPNSGPRAGRPALTPSTLPSSRRSSPATRRLRTRRCSIT